MGGGGEDKRQGTGRPPCPRTPPTPAHSRGMATYRSSAKPPAQLHRWEARAWCVAAATHTGAAPGVAALSRGAPVTGRRRRGVCGVPPLPRDGRGVAWCCTVRDAAAIPILSSEKKSTRPTSTIRHRVAHVERADVWRGAVPPAGGHSCGGYHARRAEWRGSDARPPRQWGEKRGRHRTATSRKERRSKRAGKRWRGTSPAAASQDGAAASPLPRYVHPTSRRHPAAGHAPPSRNRRSPEPDEAPRSTTPVAAATPWQRRPAPPTTRRGH